MILERLCHVQQQCAARTVIHSSVVDAISVNRFTDTDVVDVRG